MGLQPGRLGRADRGDEAPLRLPGRLLGAGGRASPTVARFADATRLRGLGFPPAAIAEAEAAERKVDDYVRHGGDAALLQAALDRAATRPWAVHVSLARQVPSPRADRHAAALARPRSRSGRLLAPDPARRCSSPWGAPTPMCPPRRARAGSPRPCAPAATATRRSTSIPAPITISSPAPRFEAEMLDWTLAHLSGHPKAGTGRTVDRRAWLIGGRAPPISAPRHFPRITQSHERQSHPQGDRRRARRAYRRPDGRQARGRRRAAQPLAAPAPRRRAARRGHAQEHPDDRPDRLRQDRDQPPAGQARRRAVRQGRGDQVHRGRLCRPRRRADRPRPRRGGGPAREGAPPRRGPGRGRGGGDGPAARRADRQGRERGDPRRASASASATAISTAAEVEIEVDEAPQHAVRDPRHGRPGRHDQPLPT